MRYLSSLSLFALAGFVYGYNVMHADRKLVLPLLDQVVGPNPETLGLASAGVIAGLGVLSLLWKRVRRAPRD